MVVVAGAHQADARGARRIHRIGIDEDLVLTIEALPVIDHALVLQAAVPVDEEESPALMGAPTLGKLYSSSYRSAMSLREGDLLQVRAGDAVLPLHPVGRFQARIVLQPAVGIGHERAVQGVACGGIAARRRYASSPRSFRQRVLLVQRRQ